MTAQTLQVIGPLANTLAWVFAENIGWEKSLWATTSLRNIITGRRRKKKRNEAEDVPIWGYVSEVSAAWNLVNWCPQKVCCYSGNWGGTGVKGLPKTDTVERMVQNKSLTVLHLHHWSVPLGPSLTSGSQLQCGTSFLWEESIFTYFQTELVKAELITKSSSG